MAEQIKRLQLHLQKYEEEKMHKKPVEIGKTLKNLTFSSDDIFHSSLLVNY